MAAAHRAVVVPSFPNSSLPPQPLTVAQLRQFPGCEHLTDEEAARAVADLWRLAHLLLAHVRSPAAASDPHHG